MLALAIAAISCTEKENGGVPGGQTEATMKGMYYAEVISDEDVIEVTPGKTKTVGVRALADTLNGSVSDIKLTLSFKGDVSAVAAYNTAHGTSYQACPGTAYEFVTNEVMMPRYGVTSSTAKLKLSSSGLEDGVTYILPVVVDNVIETDNWELSAKPYAYVIFKLAYVAPNAGSGTKEDPYNIYTVADLLKMPTQLEAKKVVYFNLQADIDMTGVTNWVPLNWESPYELGIDFNGNNHTISNFFCDYAAYPSFFGVLNGKCHDVTFTNAKVVVNDARSGILAGYCGLQDATKGIRGDCERVHIQGELDHTASTKYGAGGFFGFMGTGSLKACSADVLIKSKLNNVGGLFGYCGKVVEVEDCWTTGTIIGNQRVGGIAGGTVGDDDPTVPIRIVNCYSTAKVYGSFAMGGIGGYFNKAAANADPSHANSPKNTTPGNVFENCIAWNEEIRANGAWGESGYTPGEPKAGDLSHYSCGAIAGYTSCNNTFTNCLRKPEMKYDEVIFFDYSDAFSLYDQQNSSASAPLVVVEVAGANYNYPYHGKPAPAGKTLSEVAKSLGWSTSVWDFSGDTPVLKKITPGEANSDVDTGGQLPDFDENEFYN